MQTSSKHDQGSTTPRALPFELEGRLKELGLALPKPAAPVAAYIPARRVGQLVYIAGQIPLRDGQLIAKGSVPGEVSPEQARECARQCVLNGLAALVAAVGSGAALRQVVRIGVFVASQPGFYEQPKIANGASELLVEIFGERGQHARAAVGSIALPLGAPVEVEFLFEVA